MTTHFDTSALSWVKDEIDQALDEALHKVEAFAAAPGDAGPLRASRALAHQVSGVFSMVALDGLQRFSMEIERFAAALEKRAVEANASNLEVLTQALRALRRYLDALMAGAPDMPVRLFPEFRAMQEAMGIEPILESELFFPDMLHTAPPGLETGFPQEVEPAQHLAQLGQRYRKSLAQWVRDPAQPEPLEEMRAALLAVERAQPTPAQKTLWWVAVALIDAISAGGVASAHHVRHLVLRLERQLRYLAQGQSRPPGRLLKDVLYYVAISAPATERIRDVQRVYGLESYHVQVTAPAGTADGGGPAADVVATLQASLESLKDCWMQATTGGAAEYDAFLAQAERFAGCAAQAGGQVLHTVAVDISACAQALQAAGRMPDALFPVEMATTLLMLESALALPAAGWEEALAGVAAQSAAMRGMLPGGAQPEAMPASVNAGQVDMHDVLLQVADEIRSNLQRAEQVLDEFFRDARGREDLPAAANLLQQVGGAFHMLDQSLAAAVVAHCRTLVERFAQPGHPSRMAEFELLAESLGALGFYLDRLLHKDAEASRAIEPLPERLQACLEASPAAAAPAPAPPAAATSAAVVDRVLDGELLDVYLTEARALLGAIAGHMETLRQQPDDPAALVNVRRAFHTLKGSGRTVGLAAMGDVAWSVEQVLNQLIDFRAPVGAEVTAFIDAVTQRFREWVQSLAEQGAATLTPEDWRSQADALLKRGTASLPAQAALPADEMAPARSKPEAEPVPPAVAPADADVVIIGGTHKVGRELYALFLHEAQANLDLLAQCLQAARQQAAPPIPDIARAAHTLAGVSRTVGMAAPAELAAALEAWLEPMTPRLAQWNRAQLHLFDQALQSLQGMLREVANRRMARAATWLCSQLQQAAQAQQTQVATVAEVAETAVAASPAAAEVGPESAPPPQAGAIDPQLLEVFMLEADELMPAVGQHLRNWREQPLGTAAQQALQRALHTLKGSARMAGADVLGNQLHELETQIIKVAGRKKPAAASFTGLFRQYDLINDQLQDLRLRAEAQGAAGAGAAAESMRPDDGTAVSPMMRVRADVLDTLVNEAGEISIARTRIERQMETFKQALLELTDSVIRLRAQLREVEIEAETQMQSRLSQVEQAHEAFDPLEFDRYTRFQELTRMMAESAHDVATIQQGLLYNLNETEAALLEQARMTRELQQGLMRTRMVRFGSIAERLHRIVRQTAEELGKSAELEIHGANVDIDRSVLEKMVPPLEHLLRNALAHGLEEMPQRVAQGKPASGKIRLLARRDGNEIILTLEDDGRGLDFAGIRAKAIASGWLDASQEATPARLTALIFEPGFSTSARVSQVAGRGIGLDAVRTEITALGGRVEVASEAGRGTTFTVYLPLTLAVSQAVLVRSGKDEFLLPAPLVEQVHKLRPDALAAVEQQGYFSWADTEYPVYHLSALLGRPAPPEPQAYTPVMLLRSGLRRIALLVDEIRGNREIVVKNIGPQLAGLSGIAGATVMGDGRVMLVLNPVQMAAREDHLAVAAPDTACAEQPAAPHVAQVMVVDDSLTMRKVISRLLEREGYRVRTARDGVDALQQIAEEVPDIVLLDIEMPRMDGFELARALRGDARTARVPLIVISSRTADKHRKYAAELGVDVYLGKPYQESELLQHVARFAAGFRTAAISAA